MTRKAESPVEAITSNPVVTRSDLVSLLHSLISPLLPAQSPSGARICLSSTGAGFDQPAAELEGYARILWGLAPLVSAQPDHPDFRHFRQRWVEGLVCGVDPTHDEYWGEPGDKDQRYVEMGAIAFALIIAPKVFWTPLSGTSQSHLARWLLCINEHALPVSNWRFFRLLVNLALKSVHSSYSQSILEHEIETIDSFFGQDGLPTDGANATCHSYDYYATSFAIPFYSLIYAQVQAKLDPKTSLRYRRHARTGLLAAVNLFSPDGACIPYGRSMTYRFACSSIFAAAAYAELSLPQDLTWGHIKGLLLRNIRWFSRRAGVFNRDGTLSVGYAYPSLFMSENYNSSQSPYWALKAFLVLALPSSHPFWQAAEEPYPMHLFRNNVTVMRPWGQVYSHAAGHSFCLAAGQRVRIHVRHTAAKYGKMAYSAQFGFSVPTGSYGLSEHAPDSVLALSEDDGEQWVVRREANDVTISSKGVIRSVWRPWPDVHVVTWLVPPPTSSDAFHTRVHMISNPTRRRLLAADSGFAIDSQTGPKGRRRHLSRMSALSDACDHGTYESHDRRAAVAVSSAGMSGVVDLLGTGLAAIQQADANSNLISERTVIPMVMTEVEKENTWLATRIFARPAVEGVYACSINEAVGSWRRSEAEAGLGKPLIDD